MSEGGHVHAIVEIAEHARHPGRLNLPHMGKY